MVFYFIEKKCWAGDAGLLSIAYVQFKEMSEYTPKHLLPLTSRKKE
jgi:hypothetical protein